ncbi:AAA family ATPase [Azohydromonas australica]|uniref:AAA family ATPase n=1 Tax=Azohydromonas australica TaxID=364039 RepID=UPI0005BC6C9B|nr:MoxR family ATPase [Azohydromonas australica]
MKDWKIFLGNRAPHDGIMQLDPPPPWRPFRVDDVARERVIPAPDKLSPTVQQRGSTFQCPPQALDIVNAALYLRRPILVTGKPGSGKSSLIDAVAYELKLGEPLRWAVTSRSTLKEALYVYDAVGRLQEQQREKTLDHNIADGLPIAEFLRLGPLGTALLPTDRPRALLIDEIDKADLDLPNDLLNILEEGEFEIPELARLRDKTKIVEVRIHRGTDGETYPVPDGTVRMKQFPFVVFTSNGERDFPPAFLRRCLRLDMPDPCADVDRLTAIVQAHLSQYFTEPAFQASVKQRIDEFIERAAKETLATDQLLNAIFLVIGKHGVLEEEQNALVRAVTRALK